MDIETREDPYDVVIVGGGPGGLQAALTLGRARRRVLLCDAGARRNAAATHVYNVATRDGTPPDDFRAAARADLARYATVSVRDARVESIDGEEGDFRVRVGGADVRARRILLALGLVDEVPELPGYREAWGHAIFQCPYCHGFEVADRRFVFLASSAALIDFGIVLRNWTPHVHVLTSGAFEVPEASREALARHGIALDERPVTRIVGGATPGSISAVELADGARIGCDVIFAKPKQRQTELVARLGLDCDDGGYVRVDEMMRTSRAGIYAAGDLITPQQAAVIAMAAGMKAAATINHALSVVHAG